MLWPTDILQLETWILLLTLLILARYYLHRKWQFFENMGIPADPPSILNLGNLKSAFGKDLFIRDNQQKKKHGPIWGSYLFTSPFITIHDPDMLRQIFIKEFQNFPIRQDRLLKLNGKVLKGSLISTDGEQWKRTRSAMTPTFSTAKLKQMVEIMDWCVNNTLDALERKIATKDGVFSAKDLFSKLSLDIVCTSAFSTKVHSQDDSKNEPEIAVQAKNIFSGRFFAGPVVALCLIGPKFLEDIFVKFGYSAFPRKSLEYFKNLTDYIISERRRNPDAKNHVDLMQLMLDSEISDEKLSDGLEKGMTRDEIIANAILMILAGYENTANTMSNTAYNLAMYPDIQSKVQKEIDEMLEERGKFDYDGVNSLKMLDMCVNETLRLYHPTIRNARVCIKETTINGFTIPKGASVGIPSFALSHDPDYWDEPWVFKPERMRNMQDIDPMVFQPFGAGPRNCIGLRFAVMEVKLALSKILHEYSFLPAKDTPEPPLELTFGMSVRSTVDYNLKVIPRNEQTQ